MYSPIFTVFSAKSTFLYMILLVNCFRSFKCHQVPFLFNTRYCASETCDDIGFKIERSLNRSGNACENLYDFSCGNWISTARKPNYESLWNHHLSVTYRINRRIQNILENNKTGSVSLEKAKTFYEACINVSSNESKYLKSLKFLVEYFKGWPIIREDWTHVQGYNWLYEWVQIYKIVRVQPILKINVNIDYKNTTQHTFYIEPGNLIFPPYILTNPTLFPTELNSYKHWIYETIKHLYRKKSTTNLKVEVLKIIQFEMALAKIMGKSKMERTTLGKLSAKFPADWLRVFNYLLGKNDVKIRPEDNVIIRNYAYFKKLFLLLRKSEKKTIANYIIWCVVKELSRETTKYMRNLNFLVDKAVLGVQADLSRKIECVNKVNEYFSLAIISKYSEKYLQPQTINEVENMAQNIRVQFMKLLQKTQWMRDETKTLAIEKVAKLKCFVGYPEWTKNESLLEDYFESLNVSNNHFLNVLRAKSFLVEKELAQVNQPVKNIVWPSNVFEVNAYYNLLQNAIFVPLGILEPPFFYPNQESVFNYGALGSLIGHEISHSLDTTGRQANKDGIVAKWWPQSDISSYQKRAKCFESQYNDFNANGVSTIGENIADNTGIETSFQAFLHLNSSRVSPAIKHLEDFSKEQVFFISFAQMWCEKSDQTDLFNDEHASAINRVKGTIFNNENFDEVFNCSRNSASKCKLW